MRYAMILVGLSACFDARLAAGVACDPAAPICPSGQSCVANATGYTCETGSGMPADSSPTADMSTIDSDRPIVDASLVDAGPDATPLACNSTGLACNDGIQVMACNGFCWAACKDRETQPAAQAICNGWGGVLAPLTSLPADTTCLIDVLNTDAWIGAMQIGIAAQPSDGWTWNSMGAITTFNWQTGEPNDSDGSENGQEQCAFATRSNGTWSDKQCTALESIACRRPL